MFQFHALVSFSSFNQAEKPTSKNNAEKLVVDNVAEKSPVQDVSNVSLVKNVTEKSMVRTIVGKNDKEIGATGNTAKDSGDPQKFKCEDCDFCSCSSIKLKVHMTCEHGKMKNSSSVCDIKLKEKCESSKHYWKSGRIGIAYQTYLEALFVIEACLPRYEQVIEKNLLIEAR